MVAFPTFLSLIPVAIFVGVGCCVLAVVVLWGVRKSAAMAKARTSATARNRQWRQALEPLDSQVANLVEKSALLRQRSASFNDTTSHLCHQLIERVDRLSLDQLCAERKLEQIEREIVAHSIDSPSRWWGRDLLAYQDRVGQESMGYDATYGLSHLLFADGGETEGDAGVELMGSHEDLRDYRSSLQEVSERCETDVDEAQRLLDRIETALDQFHPELQRQSQAYRQISADLDGLTAEAHRDGFFPLLTMQQRLLPSAEALLQEAQRAGRLDPVAAYESPAKLVARQLSDAAAIVAIVRDVRRHRFGQVAKHVNKLGQMGLSTGWVDAEYFRISEKLEDMCGYAVLWPLGEKLTDFSSQIAKVSQRVSRSVDLFDRLRSQILPSLTVMERRIAAKQAELAPVLGIAPSQVFFDDVSSPAQHLQHAQNGVETVKAALSKGQCQMAEDALTEVEANLKKAGASMGMAEDVIRYGDDAWATVAARHQRLEEESADYLALAQELSERHGDQIYQPEHRFGVDRLGAAALGGDTASTMEALVRGGQRLSSSQICFRKGQLLKTGSHLAGAVEEIRFVERQLASLKLYHSAVVEQEAALHERLGSLRFRHCSFISRVADRLTTQPPRDRHVHLGEELVDIEPDCAEASGQNPFAIAARLDAVSAGLDELEQQIATDQLWYEAACDSIKLAARSTRMWQEETSANEVAEMRTELARWQSFLEEDHADWRQAYEAGVALDQQVCSRLAEVRKDDLSDHQRAAGAIDRALGDLTGLKQLANPFQIEIDREAGDAEISQARQALAKGDYSKVVAYAASAQQEARAAIGNAEAATQHCQVMEDRESRKLVEDYLKQSGANRLDTLNFATADQQQVSIERIVHSPSAGFSRDIDLLSVEPEEARTSDEDREQVTIDIDSIMRDIVPISESEKPQPRSPKKRRAYVGGNSKKSRKYHPISV